MDPYYGNDLSVLGEPLKELLQKIAVTDDDIGIKEEALHLLQTYTTGPYPILKNNKDNIPKESKPEILYLLNEEN